MDQHSEKWLQLLGAAIVGGVFALAGKWVEAAFGLKSKKQLDATTAATTEATAQGQFQDRLLKRVQHLEERLDDAEKETETARHEAYEARLKHEECERRCAALEQRVATMEREIGRDRGPFG